MSLKYSNWTETVVLHSAVIGTSADTPVLIRGNNPYAFKPNEVRHKCSKKKRTKLHLFCFHDKCVVICQEAVSWCASHYDCARSTQGSQEILVPVRKSVFIS
jgi:hypothetical protein